ncbi:MAG: hypothetical protein N2111_01495 [Candidatus Sumerlaeaceae bacterium]|nr:hypothetical protein [Candidatus Sumerlaeaceae bacterium]
MPSRCGSRIASLTTAIICALAIALVLRPSIHGNDGVQNYAYLRSLLFDGDLDFTNEYAHYMSRHAEWFDGKSIPRDPVTGLPINLYGVGNALLWAPWVLAAHGFGWVANAAGAQFVLDGYSPLYAAAVGLASAVYAAVGLVLLSDLLARMAGPRRSLLAVSIVWLASPLFFYMLLHPSMSHANSFFAATLLLVLYLGGDSLSRWAVMGAVAALMALVRFQDGALLAALAVGEVARFCEQRGHDQAMRSWWVGRLRRYGLFGLTAVAVGSLQLLAWQVLQGSALSGPRAYMDQGSFGLMIPRYTLEVLFSPRHGLFYWHPGLMIGLVGLVAARGAPRVRAMALAAFFAQLWVVASWSHWWAGASFGHRMFVSTLPFLAIGMALILPTAPRGQFTAAVVAALLVLWNFGLIVQYGSAMIPRQTEVSLATMAYNNFVVLPRMAWERLTAP